MTSCPACGAEVEQGAGTCSRCGLRLEGTTESFMPVGAPGSEGGRIEFDAAEGPTLVVRKGHELGERFHIDRPRMTLGRDPKADVFLNDVTVSRSHAVVTCVDDACEIADTGSLNGTYVNGVCVDKAPLSAGDIVQIGMFQMVFVTGTRGE